MDKIIIPIYLAKTSPDTPSYVNIPLLTIISNMRNTAIRAAQAAGKIIMSYYGLGIDVENKAGNKRDFVTAADKNAESIIKEIILGQFPEHGFWGEETGQANLSKEYLWVVDPLDGTSNFTLNIPMFSVSIALLKNKEIILGVVFVPTTNELFVAEKGKGASRNNKQVLVSNVDSLKEAIGSMGYWSKDDSRIDVGLKDFVNFAKQIKKTRYLSSTVFELIRVANGDLNFSIIDTTFLDIAAGKLIVEEAGGKVTKRNGDEIFFDEKNEIMRVVISSPALHKEIINQ